MPRRLVTLGGLLCLGLASCQSVERSAALPAIVEPASVEPASVDTLVADAESTPRSPVPPAARPSATVSSAGNTVAVTPRPTAKTAVVPGETASIAETVDETLDETIVVDEAREEVVYSLFDLPREAVARADDSSVDTSGDASGDTSDATAETVIREVGYDVPGPPTPVAGPPAALPAPVLAPTVDTAPLPVAEPPASIDAAPVPADEASLPIALCLADFEALAIAHNPSLQVAAFGVGERQGVRTQVGLRPNPVFGYAANDIGDEGTAGQQGVYLSQTFVRGRKLQLNRAIAHWDTEEAGWIAETQRHRVLNDVRTAFYDALGAQRQIEIARDLVAVAEKGVATSQALIDAEQAARPDLLQAEVQLSEVRIALANAEIAHVAAWNRLTSLVGQPYLVPTPLTGELDALHPEVEWDYAYETLLALSPELQRAEARIQRARVLVTRQCVQPTPNLLTQFGVAHDFATDNVVSSVQMGMYLPTRNRNQGNVRAAIAESHRAQRDAERIRLDLRERLAITVRDFSRARQQAERYRAEIVPKSRESFELIDAGYQQGEFDFLRVLTARRLFFESQLAYVRSLVELNRAHVALEGLLLTGGLDAVPEANDSSELRGDALSGQ